MREKEKDECRTQEVVEKLKKLIEVTSYVGSDINETKKWLNEYMEETDIKCWEIMDCGIEDKCSVTKISNKGRCWLTAGTMCRGSVKKVPEGLFAKKYKTCTKCKVFTNYVFKDPITELKEFIYILVTNIVSKQGELSALERKTLSSGLEDLKKLNNDDS